MIERTWLYFPDLLVNDETAACGSAIYSRLVTGGALIVNGIVPTSACKIKFTLDDAAQAEEYTLAQGARNVDFNVSGGGLTVAAGVVLGAIITANGGASKLRVDLIMESTVANDTEVGWVLLTAGMLQSRISAPEYNALTAAIIASGQSDPIPQILSDVTERIRSALRSGGKTALGTAGYIPAGTRRCAISLAKYDLFGRIAALRSLAEQAKTDAEKCERWLERIEEGKLTFEAPTTVVEEQTTGVSGSEAINEPDAHDSFKGL